MAKDMKIDIKIAGQVDPSLGKSINQVKKGLGDIGKGVEIETKEINNSMQNLQDIMLAAGITEILQETYDAFMDCSDAAKEYESNLKAVETIADTSAISMGQIHDELIDLSNDTGVAASQLSDATYQAISASVDTAESVKFVNEANELAVGGFTKAETAVDVLTTALNAYNLSADYTGQISDYLITTQNKGKTTVDQLASSVGKVIPIAAAYNVQMDNLSTSYAIMTANGIQTAEAGTYLKSMLNELADSTSKVSKTIFDQTGKSFSELNAAGYSLGDVLKILGDTVNGDATAFSNLWSSSEAATGALSIYNSGAEKYNSTLDQMRNSAGATSQAYQKMADTTAFSQQKMENAFDNLQVVVGEQLNPSLKELYDDISSIMVDTGEFVKDHPKVVNAITALATSLAVVTAAVTAYTVATKAAEIASGALTAIMEANPLLLGGMIAVGAIVGITEYIQSTQNAIDTTEELTFETREMEDELDSLKKQYDSACDKYGENSKEAGNLALKIDELQKKYDSTKQTIGELKDSIESLNNSISETYDTYTGSITSSDDLLNSSKMLVSELVALKSQSELTSGEMQTLNSIVEKLNSNYSDLGLTVDASTGKLNYSTADLYDYVTKEAEKQKKDAAEKALVETLQNFGELRNKFLTSEDESSDAWKFYEDKSKQWEKKHPFLNSIGVSDINTSSEVGLAYDTWEVSNKNFIEANTAYKKCKDAIQEYYQQLGHTEEESKKFITQLEDTADAAEKVADKIEGTVEFNSYYESGMNKVETAVSGISGELKQLGQAYDKVYDDTYNSIDGQIGLFDKLKLSSQTSVDDMSKALKSQQKFLDRYSKNIKKASNIGLNDKALSQLSNGSSEAAGQLDAIVQKFTEIKNSDGAVAAKKWINRFNKQFENVEESKETFSNCVASMETNFNKSMDNITNKLKTAVDDMDLSGSAGVAATQTMNAYITAIKNKTSEAISAADGVAVAVSEALQAGKKKSSNNLENYTAKYGTEDIPRYAKGDIITKPTLAYIAEDGYDEAAIPINGSKRSLALWEETGRRLGVYNKPNNNRGASTLLNRLDNNENKLKHTDNFAELRKVNDNKENNMEYSQEIKFAPVINISGNVSKETVNKGIQAAYSEFKRMMKQYEFEKRRGSMRG